MSVFHFIAKKPHCATPKHNTRHRSDAVSSCVTTEQERSLFRASVSVDQYVQCDRASQPQPIMGCDRIPQKIPSDVPIVPDPDHWILSEDRVEFARSGRSRRLFQSLRRKKMPVHAVLDVHGFTRYTVLSEVDRFLNTAVCRQLQHVLLIHGKNVKIPILKNILNLWLREQPFVLAFCSGNQHTGGAGVLHILLRRSYDI